MNIQKLIIEDVRCFAGRQEFNIRPLTFLVGENSTGKSTALGCFQTLHSFIGSRTYRTDLDFNADPYQMGAFADIVRKSSPRKKSFLLGFEFQSENRRIEYFAKLTEKGSEPVIQEQKVIFRGIEEQWTNEIVLVKEEQDVEQLEEHGRAPREVKVSDFSEENGNKKFLMRVPLSFFDESAFRVLDYWQYSISREDRKKLLPTEEELRICMKKLSEFRVVRDIWDDSSYSFAPIRSKPQRTYDPLKENISPEGGDIPMVLRNISQPGKERWEKLKEGLIEFGKSSGLFADIHVRRFGKSVGDPFQLQIKVRGPKANMIDVGYGVNQVLPILVRLLADPRTTIFLMQQPEVHLHPKGQAELSSLLINLLKRQRRNFVIETHSDYMVDRARIEIMKKRIVPEDVSLIYLEPAGNHVTVHNITFDEQANLIDAPASYRDFFLKESDKLLGLD